MIFNITKDTNSFDIISFGSRTSLFGRVVKQILLFVTGHGRADAKNYPRLIYRSFTYRSSKISSIRGHEICSKKVFLFQEKSWAYTSRNFYIDIIGPSII